MDFVEKKKIIEDARAFIIDLAKNKQTATYTDFAAHLGLGDPHNNSLMSQILQKITIDENKKNNALPTVLITYEKRQGGLPADAFFVQAKSLNYKFKNNWEFFESQKAHVFETYKDF